MCGSAPDTKVPTKYNPSNFGTKVLSSNKLKNYLNILNVICNVYIVEVDNL